MKVVGRAGTGVDNIDVNAATKKGIIVLKWVKIFFSDILSRKKVGNNNKEESDENFQSSKNSLKILNKKAYHHSYYPQFIKD